ncbi:MAG TPA: PQQ-binding-like beta-propeller repeat protein [Terriglobia bacterium]|nr:PQQ-binding-like beta-propeller repeat protein [Terriglobia bacterium]
MMLSFSPGMMARVFACLLAAESLIFATGPAQSRVAAGRAAFETNCAICHGADATGGERGPSLMGAGRSKAQILNTIRKGKAGGMPAFHLPPKEESAVVDFVYSLNAAAGSSRIAGNAAAGKAYFWGKGGCGNCHMIYGRGGVKGPDLTTPGGRLTLRRLEKALISPGETPGYQVVSVQLKDGSALRGFARNESSYDLQLQDFDGNFHFLRQDDIIHIERDKMPLMPAVHLSTSDLHNLLAYLSKPTPPEHPPEISLRGAVPGPGDWPTYNGQPGGNRYSTLDQINTGNISRLAPRWTFQLPGAQGLETTPVVIGGLMIVTAPNEAYALDAASGREVWHYRRAVAVGQGAEAEAANRGVAVLGDKIFMGTPDAHLLALNWVTGGLVWDVKVADYREEFKITAAPLVVGDLVITGIGFGDLGARGFVAAYKASTGKQVWRFYTMPGPGDPMAKTWVGRALPHGGAATWMTGTYDPEDDLLIWTTGNPCPDFNGDERKGDNLYSDSVVALKPETGKLQWYFQFTPHDTHDWDAQEAPLLVDAEFHGQKRHLLLQANRNGFFYVLDRTTGQFLMGKPFVHKLTWARGIAPDSRPDVLPGTAPTLKGVKVCPSSEGATNWMSPAWSPATDLFYVQALEKCNIYFKGSDVWVKGKEFRDQIAHEVPGEPGEKYVRAIDIQTGKVVWERPQVGPAKTWGGLLATAGGLVLFCDDGGAFAAVDARTGKLLWHFSMSEPWHASPMTYTADGKQYIAIATGSGIMAFGL